MAQWVMDWHLAEDKASLCLRVGPNGGARGKPLAARADAMDVDSADEGEESGTGFGEGVSKEREELDDGLGEKLKVAQELAQAQRPSPSSALPILEDADSAASPSIASLANASANEVTVRPSTVQPGAVSSVDRSAVEEVLEMMDAQRTDEQREVDADPLRLTVKSQQEDEGDRGTDPAGLEEALDGSDDVEMVDVSKPPVTDASGMPAVVQTGVDLGRKYGEFPPPELPDGDIKPLPLPTNQSDHLGGVTPSPAPIPAIGLPLVDIKGLRPGAADPTLSMAPLLRQEVGYEAKTVSARLILQKADARSLIFPLSQILAIMPPVAPSAPTPALTTPSALPTTLAETSTTVPTSTPSTETSNLPTYTPHSPELSSLVLSDLFGDIALYTMPTPLTESQILAGRVDRRIDDATTSGGKLAHTSRLLDVKPVLVSTLQPSKRRRDEWEDLSDLWGVEETRDLMDFKTDPVPSGTSACFLFIFRWV